MDVLIVYGTYSGGTLEVAHEIANTLTEQGHKTTLENIMTTSDAGTYALNDAKVLEGVKSHDLVIIGSCTWFEEGEEGQMHSGFRMFEKKTDPTTFEGVNFAIYALGDSNYAQFCRAAEHLEKFIADKKGSVAVPSLRINRYYARPQEVKKTIRQWVQQLLTTAKEKPRS
ncbi:hypothetical protein A3G67_02580 [Candidatus Roizmanbacteria bacterium RIFCSPLOWO2_12_FULL_40_12]|uniref:Flavodoxin-like domain-containing protein n=1 Tax=Candidatus Roizmanbacteria bacterium RIFCSPLOWO2_01_FULL_40_42 TaxID=1802066 RepID=A0A1F7J608_9BACT|nr:MAG: hypothetical protein A2779_03870 [Candidatus Roizmanbacteria bacterium RIFCSPHIGHO2_01_FULL_40_98]OGK27868.1 MAG: hypothetical protein A3C31_03835 [Candidatus Roizmanbacteria bacterium RIFCSPHIGHO2_02_FULL_40_53]OGK29419.1 MAG: hypothetical protein A2W49_04200 [Candidatus Roizmanbacteria bacterium RIFCSPHIGHO2_12_41_18]OGK36622.1 MAG: hypothetical protein A3E69_00105 [Candidatus Roizmanbacteria bacterium RIFCSPHIGHO2_12_FULL_40_130]OGK51060.1 MAG: hypothetical protein A3B50_02755 [Candi